jgi:two-component system chemotaxis sensor kinase CheA
MSHGKLTEKIEEIAAAAVMADAAEETSVRGLRSLCGELAELLTPDHDEELLAAVGRCHGLIGAVLKGEATEPEGNLEEVCSIVTSLQAMLRPTEQPTLIKGVLRLPAHVDNEIFEEFLETRALAQDEIEQAILALERGDTGKLNTIRGQFHTMKGEAGVLGLDDLVEVCHTVEDFLERELPVWEQVDRLLQVKDWVSGALEAYNSGSMPAPPAAEIVAMLEPGAPDAGPPDAPAGSETIDIATADNEVPPHALPPGTEKPTPDPSPPPLNADGREADVAQASAKGSGVGDSSEDAEDQTGARPLAGVGAGETEGQDHDYLVGPEAFKLDVDDEDVALVGEFLQESEEGLASADQILLDIEHRGVDQEMVNGLFRVFHTIKGVAGFLELKAITSLAHITETMLNMVRNGQILLQDGVLDVVFDATAMMRKLMEEIRRAVEEKTEVEPNPGLNDLLRRIQDVSHGQQSEETEELPEAAEGERLGEILIKAGSVPAEAVDRALESQRDSGRPLGEELIAQGAVEPKEVAKALRAQSTAGRKASKIRETVKVDLERVDSLVEIIGELVIVESMVAHAPDIVALSSPRIRNYLGQLTKITRDLQDIGMRMRMVPLRGVFQKMSRMVRDLARKGGKSINMQVSGEWTEMDRSMVEQIGDPLVHLIRNAVDHGMETADGRQQAGKPMTGTIRLSAYHEGGSISIEISDDGRGLDREAIVDKALRQGIISDAEGLTDQDIHDLIMAPGFSTAKQVTEISGRGVGMDVVRRNIEAMRGRIQVSSTPGQGTTFKLVLPLTLAIIDGMLVACGEEQFIIPTLSIIESIQPHASMLRTLTGTREMINVRGEILPLLRVDRMFGIENAKQDPTEALVVIVESLGRKVGLLVDDVVTQQQVVIKSLGSGLQSVSYVAGAAILSDGRVGLILNVDELRVLVGEGGGAVSSAWLQQQKEAVLQAAGPGVEPVGA